MHQRDGRQPPWAEHSSDTQQPWFFDSMHTPPTHHPDAATATLAMADRPAAHAAHRVLSGEEGFRPTHERGWNTWIGFFVVTLVTTAAAVIDVQLTGSVTAISGVTLTSVSFISAMLMRRSDLSTAAITPPIAFLIAIVTAVQFEVIGAPGNLLLQEASAIVTALAFNAPWVFLATGLAFVTVLIRGIRFRRREVKHRLISQPTDTAE